MEYKKGIALILKQSCTAKVASVVNDIKINDVNMVYQGTYAPVIIAIKF